MGWREELELETGKEYKLRIMYQISGGFFSLGHHDKKKFVKELKKLTDVDIDCEEIIHGEGLFAQEGKCIRKHTTSWGDIPSRVENPSKYKLWKTAINNFHSKEDELHKSGYYSQHET